MHLDEAAEARSSLKPGGGSASLKLGNRGLGPQGLASMMETYNLMYTPKLWTIMDERSLRLTESSEVSKLAPIIPHRLAFGHSAVRKNRQTRAPRCVCACARVCVCLCLCVCVGVCSNLVARADRRFNQR